MNVITNFLVMLLNLFLLSPSSGPLAQQSQSFTLSVNATVTETTQLFGPIREAEWEPDWHPVFVHPESGAQRPGVVFTRIAGHDRTQLWTLTEYDEHDGRVAYVIVEPGFMVSEIQVQISADGPTRSRATVMHRRTALSESANEIVEKLTPHWATSQRPHWEAAINAAVQKANHQ
jgi:hypothetical protein